MKSENKSKQAILSEKERAAFSKDEDESPLSFAAGESSAKMTVAEVIEEFILYEQSVRGLSSNTVIGYKNDLLQFSRMEFIGSETLIEEVKTEDIKMCIGELSVQKKSCATINRFISSVRSMFAYCRKFGYIKINPALEVKTVKNPKRLPDFMTGAEVDAICAQPEKKELLWQTRDKALFESLYSSGCRVSEITSLKLADLKSDCSSAIVKGKGNKERRVYFEADAQNALRLYLADRRARFPQKDINNFDSAVFLDQRGGALTSRGVHYILSRYSGVEGTNRHVSPHAFRHTFATAMVTSGADVRLVQELLGHSSISTTQRYTHVSSDKLIEMYNKAHPHGGNKT